MAEHSKSVSDVLSIVDSFSKRFTPTSVSSQFYTSDNEAVETWTLRRFFELKALDSIGVRCRLLQVVIPDPANTQIGNFFAYQRVKLVERQTGAFNTTFLGRVEKIEPEMSDDFGQVVVLTCRDYLQELAERTLNTNYGTPKVRSALISDIIDDYFYAGNVTKNIETSGSSETTTRDVRKSQITPLELIEDLAREDPWTNKTWDSPAGAVWRWDNSGSTWVDDTVEADSAAGTPFAFIDAVADYRYFGRNNPFCGLTFDLQVMGNYGTIKWEYLKNGDVWTEFTPTKAYDFTADGSMLFDPPADWVAKAFSNGDPHGAAPPNATSRYWIRCSVASITADATVKSVEIVQGNGYDYYVDDAQVFQYFRRGSKPSGGALSNGLTIEYGGTMGDQVRRMFDNYSFYEIPQEIITRVTVRGIDSDGASISATETDSTLETSLKIVKEHVDFVQGATTTAELTLRAKALLRERGNSSIKRGKAVIARYPFYKTNATYHIVRAGDLVRAKCSKQSIDEDMLVLEVTYQEPSCLASLTLLSSAWGRGFVIGDLASIFKKLREGLAISTARIGDLVVDSAKITSLEAVKVIISGSITLADWRDTTDPEKFDGGVVYEGTIDKTGLNFTAFEVDVDTLDDMAEGTEFQRLLATNVSAGNIKLTSVVTADGEWYNESGVEIDATHGINIYGQANALTTRATKTGTIQCYVGADGKLYAGAGAVILDATGITVTSGLIKVPATGWRVEIASGGTVPLRYWDGATDKFKVDNAGNVTITGVITVVAGSNVEIGADVTGDHQGDVNIDNIGQGSTYWKIATTEISAGHIKLSTTVKDGEWYNESGVEIDAAHGINIYGVNNAFTTRATKTGTIQCYVGSDGKIYAGGGNVKIGADGINFIGLARARFYEGAVLTGIIDVATGTLFITAEANKDIVISTSGTGKVQIPEVHITSKLFVPAVP